MDVASPAAPLPMGPSPRGLLRLVQSLLPCARELRRLLELGAAAEDLNELEFLLLASCGLGTREAPSQASWAAELGLSNAHVSQLVEGLRQRGWMVAHRLPTDRRKQVWQLTPAGRERLARSVAYLTPFAERLEALVPPSTLQHLTEQLARLRDALPQVGSTTDAGSEPCRESQPAAFLPRQEAA